MQVKEEEIQQQKYSAYKNSGVEWLGEIPEHWELKRFKHIFKEKKITNNVDLNCGSISFGKVVYKDDEKVPVSTKKSYQVLNEGEFLVNPLNLNYDLISLRIALSDKDVVVSSGYIIVQNVTELSKNYYKWLLHIFDVAFMKTLGSGVRQTLSFNHIANSELVFPLLKEQTAIAQFLDDKTTKIEDAIAIKEQQINLLKERKKILIHNAVTRGLNPNVKLKDSGVEWIGEIPEHWEVKALKYFCFITKLTGFEYTNVWKTDAEGEIIALRGFNIQVGESDLSETEAISEKLSNSLLRTKLNKNDIVYPCTGTIGNAALIKEDNKFHINQNIARICPQSKEMFPEYFLKSLLSYATKSQIDFNNSSQMQPVILIGSLRNIKISFPLLSEQKKISEYIETTSQKIESAIGLKQQEISTLKEYKGSLINSVVTGKVRVC